MKRIIAIILLMCIIALSGCNTENPDTNEISDNTTIPNESTNIPNQNISQGGIEEKHFVLESNGYKLNAVYTYIDDGNAHPAVLLIAGSGPSDYDDKSHFGYKIDTTDHWSIYTQVDFPNEVISAFTDFIKGD